MNNYGYIIILKLEILTEIIHYSLFTKKKPAVNKPPVLIFKQFKLRFTSPAQRSCVP